MKIEQTMTTLACVILFGVGALNSASASDADDLTAMVQEFLGDADKQDAHARFWADDLIYTSSSGLRFGKAEIMEGFGADDAAGEESTIEYSGENFDVRLYDEMAVVAFKLVGTPADANTDVLYYFNTGTFLKRNEIWQVVAWQATKIPSAK